MQEDEDAARPKRRLSAMVLDPLGVEELRAYIDELREEIARTIADPADVGDEVRALFAALAR